MAIFIRTLILSFLLVGCSEEITSTADLPHRGDKVNTTEYPNVANSIYGGWMGPNISTYSGITLIPQIFINNKRKVAFSMACSSSDKSTMFATVNLENILSYGNRIYLSNSIENTFYDNGDSCSSRVEAGAISFFVEGEKLRVHHDIKGDAFFSRMLY